MERRSPTLDGFSLMFRQPMFGLAEVAWRWSFGLAVWALLTFSSAEYFDTLPVTRGDLLLLRSRQPALIARAILRILHGSGVRVARTSVVLALCLAIAWIVVAAVARAATIKALLDQFRVVNSATRPDRPWSARSLFGLNFLRVAAFLAAAVASLAPLIAAGRSPAADAVPGSTFLVFMGLTMLVYTAWNGLNWFLSLAALFAVSEGEDTFGAIGTAIDFCRTHFSSICAVGTWFGLAHVGAFAVAAFLGLFSVGLLGALPAAVAFLGVLFATLLYFAAADFLYIGRLAGYVAILGAPTLPVGERVHPNLRGSGPASALENPAGSSIDQNELILSDLPSVAS
jgi:hypothetical protein